jgi:ABC-type methionine transport system ATPase subunit
VGEPSMVLADEPTASLDKASGREVVDRMQSLAKERGTTILLVTHDNRILDVADRILHLEDGKLTTFTEAVIANTQQMMHLVAQATDRQHLEQLVDGMDEATFRNTLQELTGQSQRFLEATALASDEAYQSMLEQSLRIFTRRVGELLQAERASLFLVDHERQQMVLRVAQDMPEGDYVRIPWGQASPVRRPARDRWCGWTMPMPTRASTARSTSRQASVRVRCSACRCRIARARYSP